MNLNNSMIIGSINGILSPDIPASMFINQIELKCLTSPTWQPCQRLRGPSRSECQVTRLCRMMSAVPQAQLWRLYFMDQTQIGFPSCR